MSSPSKCDPAKPCELVISASGKDHTLLLSGHEVHYGGRPVALLILRDVTTTRALENEVARQRESLSHVQKMEAVGRVSAGIAHDFNNQLSVIVTNATAILQSPGTDDRHRMDLEEIISAVERGRRLTSQLLAFGRRQAPKPEVVDVNEVLRHLERVLQRLVGASIVLVVRCTHRPALVRIDRLHLEQVLLALATNAADAMPQGGTLIFEVARASGQVKLSVRDTGCGIAPEIIDRVFEPFFSTKGKLGTGLGLASAYSYAQTAGATIEVHSNVGQGTEFLLRFPPVEIEAQRGREEEVEATPQPPRVALTILLVDDEEGVRRGFSRLLRRRGHRVLEASGAREAFALFDTEKVDVLVTDIAMPETDGRTLASELRKRRGDLPVLFISGQFHEADSPKGPSVAFLAKPFPPEVLCSKLEALARQEPERAGALPLQPTE